MTFLKKHWQLIVIVSVIFVLWNTLALFPLKMLVIFLHELSHGLAAYLTGGSIESISLSADQGGVAMTRGGNRFAILTAGYLGSLLFGVALLVIAVRTKLDHLTMAGLGAVMLLITGLFIRDLFPMAFGAIVGAAMLAMSRYMTRQINDLALRVIGLTSMIYVPYDIISDTILRSYLRSDARMLAEEFGGTTIMWGLLWLLISLAVIAWSLRHCLQGDSNISFGLRR